MSDDLAVKDEHVPDMKTHSVVTLLAHGRATLKQTITLPADSEATIQVVPVPACVDAQSIHLKDATTGRFISTQLEELMQCIVQKDGVKYEGYFAASAASLSNIAEATSLTLYQTDGQRVLIREPDVIDIPRQEFRVLFCPTPISDTPAAGPADALTSTGGARQFQLNAKLSSVQWQAKGMIDVLMDGSNSARVSLSAVISDVNRNNVHADELYLSCEKDAEAGQAEYLYREQDSPHEHTMFIMQATQLKRSAFSFGGGSSPKLSKALGPQDVIVGQKPVTAARVYGPVRDVNASHGLSLDVRTIENVRMRRYNWLVIGESESGPHVQYDFLVPAEDSLPTGSYQVVEQGELIAAHVIAQTHKPHRVQAKSTARHSQIRVLAETAGMGKLADDEWEGKLEDVQARAPQVFHVAGLDCQEIAVTGKRAYVLQQIHKRAVISDQYFTMLQDVDMTLTNQTQKVSCVRMSMSLCSDLDEYKMQCEPADIPMRAWLVSDFASRVSEKLDKFTVWWEFWIPAGRSVHLSGSACSVKV
eukprot:TRINITY_DN2391_c0_g1_i1.p1 TRINITY_DN2391_c0_g1~~TRINITY_DN2391_c0_g1_i1.p1  ORF type:complete len:550 (+),score=105.13 TRINITY_DN2391_c0_g1_i1:57-1652(+)